MCDNIEDLEIEVSTLKEKNRILEMRVSNLEIRIRRHINLMDAHQP